MRKRLGIELEAIFPKGTEVKEEELSALDGEGRVEESEDALFEVKDEVGAQRQRQSQFDQHGSLATFQGQSSCKT